MGFGLWVTANNPRTLKTESPLFTVHRLLPTGHWRLSTGLHLITATVPFTITVFP